jgi:ABC-type Fe3+/spermidine/putrescine transport system ATPase subunit
MRIDIERATKRFGSLAAVSEVSLSIQEGELFTLLGPSACGKTTLLRLIAGFFTPDEGEIRFDGKRVNEVPPNERGIGMVFQNFALWPHMTVSENIGYGLKLRRVDRARIADRTVAVLEKVKLAGLGDRFPGQLSGGQQQRVALARALVLNPKILLLDEPLSNLDAKVRVQVRQEIRKLQKELGITTMYVTHDQEEALTLSDRIAVFNQGKVFQVGPPKELYERPANRFVADFIGINNLIDGTVEAIEIEERRLRVKTVVGELSALLNERLRIGDRCILCIRPENAALNGEGALGGNFVKGRITFAAYLGNALRYDVELATGLVFKVDVRDPWHNELLPTGKAVTIIFPYASTVAIAGEK